MLTDCCDFSDECSSSLRCNNTFTCESDGKCLPFDKFCDGKLWLKWFLTLMYILGFLFYTQTLNSDDWRSRTICLDQLHGMFWCCVGLCCSRLYFGLVYWLLESTNQRKLSSSTFHKDTALLSINQLFHHTTLSNKVSCYCDGRRNSTETTKPQLLFGRAWKSDSVIFIIATRENNPPQLTQRWTAPKIHASAIGIARYFCIAIA